MSSKESIGNCNTILKENGEDTHTSSERVRKVYSIGWNDDCLLIIDGCYVSCECKNATEMNVLVEYNTTNKNVILYEWDDKNNEYRESEACIEHGKIIDLSDNGERWEGSCIEDMPFGYGVLFDKNSHVLYVGVIFEGMKICYGEEYYEDIGLVEYQGMYVNNERHGEGSLFDKNGKLVYEGEWCLGRNDYEDLLCIPDHCDDQSLFTSLVKELIVGEYCYNDMNYLYIHNNNVLEKIRIKKYSFREVIDFILVDCANLIELIIEAQCFDDGDYSFFGEYPDELEDFGYLDIKRCPKLKTIDIGSNSFHNYCISVQIEGSIILIQ